MSWLLSLFRRQSDELALLLGDDEFAFDIVGESHYQEALEGITGGKTRESARFECRARLVMETDNPHSRNAVAVMIKSKKVGHLSGDHAIEYRKAMREAGFRGEAECRAMIVGGWDRGPGRRGSFGVKLDLLWPPVIRAALP